MKFKVTHGGHILTLEKATEMEVEQLNSSLSELVDHWRFDPKVQEGYWDGRISYFKNNKYAPAGLWKEIYGIGEDYGYEVEIEGVEEKFDQEVDKEEVKAWCSQIMEGHEIDPRDYQKEVAYKIIRNKCCSSELATSAGKTLLSFLVMKYLIEKGKAERILMIVPTKSLVEQGYDDMKDFDVNGDPLSIQKVYEGHPGNADVHITIGTYQSLVKKKKEYFKDFDVVCVDEMHKIKASSIKKVLGKCGAKRRFGMTGTFPHRRRDRLEYLTVSSYTGPLIAQITAKHLQDEGYIASCKVEVIQLEYQNEKDKESFRALYEDKDSRPFLLDKEKRYARRSYKRMNFIKKIARNSTKNSLFLFQSVEYGKEMYNAFREDLDGKNVFYVDGEVDTDLREQYKLRMEEGENKVLVASYGTFSTGIDIKNIHTVVFTESYKSDVIVRQSIGRGLRLHKDKGKLIIIDIVDDLRTTNFRNYLFKHGEERKRIYERQGFDYNVKEVHLSFIE